MFEILKIFFVYIVSLNLSAFLGVGLLALFFQFKKEACEMRKQSGVIICNELVQKEWFGAYTSVI